MQAVHDVKWLIEQSDDKIVLQLIGELSRNTLLPLWKELKDTESGNSFLSPQQISSKNIYLDLSDISRIDSAGFALLCDVIMHCRKAQQENKLLILKNVPSQLLTLADLVGLSDWITAFIK